VRTAPQPVHRWEGTQNEKLERSFDPLPSWNNGPAKKAILDFVKATTEKSSPQHIEPKDRIATFDQDGTLWTGHPLYAQAMFAFARLGQVASQHPGWKGQLPFKAVPEHDSEAMGNFTEQDWVEIVAATHAGMSTEEFQGLVKQWLATAKAPRFAGSVEVYAGEGLQDLHRDGGRAGVCARLQRTGVRRAPGADSWLEHCDQVR
jgi:hypothetical protein